MTDDFAGIDPKSGVRSLYRVAEEPLGRVPDAAMDALDAAF